MKRQHCWNRVKLDLYGLKFFTEHVASQPSQMPGFMVTFRYRDSKSSKPATRTLPAEDLLWLRLQHVLPKRCQRARNFGFLHYNCPRYLRMLQVLSLPMAVSEASSLPHRPLWGSACGAAMEILRLRMRPESVPACAAPPKDRPDKAGSLEASKH